MNVRRFPGPPLFLPQDGGALYINNQAVFNGVVISDASAAGVRFRCQAIDDEASSVPGISSQLEKCLHEIGKHRFPSAK